MADASTGLAGPNRPLGHRSGGRARASFSGVLWNFGNVAVSTLLTLSVFLVTSRILAPADFGAVALATAIVTIAATFVPMAFGEALVQRAELKETHLHTVFWMTGVLGTGAYGAMVWAAPILAGWTEPIIAEILPILALRVVLDALLTVPVSLIARRMQFRTIALRTTLANALGAIVCLWLVFDGYALWALVMSQLVNSAASLVIAAWAAGYRPRVVFSTPALSELKHFGLFSMGGRMVYEARVDQFLLGLVLGAPALGLFFFARRLFSMLIEASSGIFSPVTNVLIASLHSDAEKRRTAYLVASFASAALAFPIFGGLLAVAPNAVPLVFGQQWNDAIFPVQCFAALGIMNALGMMQASLIRNIGRPDWWFGYQVVVQMSVIPIILIFAPFGLDAIMMALVIRTIILWPVSVRKVGALLDMPVGHYLRSLHGPAIGVAALIPMVMAVPFVLPALGPSLLLFVQVLVGASVYALALLATSWARMREIRGLISKRETA